MNPVVIIYKNNFDCVLCRNKYLCIDNVLLLDDLINSEIDNLLIPDAIQQIKYDFKYDTSVQLYDRLFAHYRGEPYDESDIFEVKYFNFSKGKWFTHKLNYSKINALIFTKLEANKHI